MKLILDCWIDGSNTATVIERPSMSSVMNGIDALDAQKHTMISLMEKEDCYLLIGGPCLDGYLVNGTLDNREFFSPKNSTAGSARVLCYIGGQDGDYRAEQFVPREIAEVAVARFLEAHDFSPEIEWYARNGSGPRLESRER
jgi:hypothetical protein